MSRLNDGESEGWQSSDLHYVNSLFYGTQTRHRYALICSWALTALGLFVKSVTTDIQRILELIYVIFTYGLCFLGKWIGKTISYRICAMVQTTVRAKITPYTAIKKATLPSLPSQI